MVDADRGARSACGNARCLPLGHVVQQPTALTDQQHQAAAAVVVALVHLQMLGGTRCAWSATRSVIRRAGVAGMRGVLFDDLLLGVSVHDGGPTSQTCCAAPPMRDCGGSATQAAADPAAARRGYHERLLERESATGDLGLTRRKAASFRRCRVRAECSQRRSSSGRSGRRRRQTVWPRRCSTNSTPSSTRRGQVSAIQDVGFDASFDPVERRVGANADRGR